MNTLRKFALKGWSGGRHATDPGRPGFTLVELLVVIATVAVLAAVLLPALAGTKPNGQAFQCLNNTRRLTLGWTMYADENSDKLMEPARWISGQMDWSANTDNTDVSTMLDSNALIASYVKSAALFKCPSDIYQSPQCLGPRIRSVSLDGALGGSPTLGSAYAPPGETRTYFSARKMSDLNTPGPANIYVILDEHPDSINDGAFMLNAGRDNKTAQKWRDYPGSFHNNAVSLSFADGHSEIHKWLTGTTIQGVEYRIFSTTGVLITYPVNQASVIGDNKDYDWLEDRMPYR